MTARLRELLAKATPGPWGYDLNHTVAHYDEDREWGRSVVQLPHGVIKPTETDKVNAELICEMRNHLGELLDAAERGEERRKHTWSWIARHYGKLEDWARKILPEPWRDQFFGCIANGLYNSMKDVGEPFESRVGIIVPSNYFKMETAQEQLLFDHMKRSEAAEARADRMAKALRDWESWEAEWLSDKATWCDGLPYVSPSLMDKYIELQKQRSEALRKEATKP